MNIKKGKIGAPYKYEFSFKRKICKELLEGQFSFSELCKKYNIGAPGTIMKWLTWYQNEEKELVNLQPMEINSSKSDSAEPAPDDKTLKELQAGLRLAQLKVVGLETMIDIAEKQFNIDIRKKSGTKPSNE